MVMKGQGRSEGANSSALKPSSAKFLGGSKNSEPVGSNPAPTIGGSMGSLDLFKLSDVNIQNELDKVTRYLELLVSRGRPLGDDTWHAQLEAMLAAARGESAHRAVDRAMQDGMGIAPSPKVDSMLAQVTGQLVTTVIREHTAPTGEARLETPPPSVAPSAPPAEVGPSVVLGFEGVVVDGGRAPQQGAAQRQEVAVDATPYVVMAEAQVQTCAAGRGQKRHSATQTIRTMAAPLASVPTETDISSSGSSRRPSSSGSDSSRSSGSGSGSGCNPADSASEDSGSTCECARCGAKGVPPPAATPPEAGSARLPVPRKRNARHRRRPRSLQAIRLSDRSRFTEAVTV
ncbi:uncharacterized protein LOC122383237 [Amphibalanus amphitrite]|uniref:uncharacterized protein LOC122383237 n=1 Tax=Amphibalanus amphitrite TaxID=1232801 RepID=UPI001C91DBDB|nr:uncharacterized protein LOC122383237 [Amphibalanus amphitrite]